MPVPTVRRRYPSNRQPHSAGMAASVVICPFSSRVGPEDGFPSPCPPSAWAPKGRKGADPGPETPANRHPKPHSVPDANEVHHETPLSGPVAYFGNQEIVARRTKSLQHEPQTMWSALLASRAQ